MKYLKVILAALSSLMSVVTGGFLFYQHITFGIGIELYFFGCIFILSSVVCFVLPLDYKLFELPKYSKGFVIWLMIMLTTIFTLWTYDFVKNLSKDVFVAKFYYDCGIELRLRENGTYKAINENWMSGFVSYGKYKVERHRIIVIDNSLTFGTSVIVDTLDYKGSQVFFRLENNWKEIKNGKMTVTKNELF